MSMSNSEVNSVLTNLRMYKQHFKTIKDDEQSSEEQKEDADYYLGILYNFIDEMAEYVLSNFNLGKAKENKSMDAAEYQDTVQRLDELRTAHHNGIIINLKMVNMSCRRNGLRIISDALPEKYEKIGTESLMKDRTRRRLDGEEATVRTGVAQFTRDFILGCCLSNVDKDYNKDYTSYMATASGLKNVGNSIKDMVDYEN